ncbi:cytochrome P450 [Pholiota conissans]|uniref:Cytochrome P450 n=1 Tax=Pholiota conissans TaxID=109636 RepID=A0A9P6CVN4_9AGAR|nr:cytochrome P450 [Pholiota conissans]
MSDPTSSQERPVYVLFLFGLLVTLLSYRYFAKSSLPPGPPKLPLIGSLLSFPSSFEWETFSLWGKRYKSDVIHAQVFGTSIIILNSVKACSDLMEKRSSIYSSRPNFTLITQYMGFAWLLPFLPYGSPWKDRRRLFMRYFQSKTADFNETQKAHQVQYARQLLLRLLEMPEEYMKHTSHFIGGTLRTMAYGTKTKETNDPYIIQAEQVMKALSDTAIPISGILDSMPWMLPIVSSVLSIPPFNKTPAQWKELATQFRDEPFLEAKRQAVSGETVDGFVPRSLEDIDPSRDMNEQETLIKDIAGVVFIGGSSTTTAVLHTFFLAMVCFPDAQAKAQEELDRVIGRGRLPDFNDEPFLPYISALIKEVQRWNPPGPMGIPHFLEEDDQYQGYVIPGQSLIITNIWAILNDETIYPNPRLFNPDRFLKDGKLHCSILDPVNVGFGFGRRICPGVSIALSAIWISVASILANFTISKARDENGQIIEPSMKYHSGVTFQPLPFKCAIKPRHDKVGSLIESYVSIFA